MKQFFISIFVFLPAFAFAQAVNNTREIRQEIADSLRSAIFNIYPLELLDSVRVDSLVSEFASSETEMNTDNIFGQIQRDFDKLNNELQDRNMRLIRRTNKNPLGWMTKYDSLQSNFALISVKGQYSTYTFFQRLDQFLSSAQTKRGLIFDLRNCRFYEPLATLHICERFITEKKRLPLFRQRIEATTESRDSAITLMPVDNPFTKPMVIILRNNDWDPSFLMSQVFANRSWTRIIEAESFVDYPLRGVAAKTIPLPHETYLEIPTAIALNENGDPVIQEQQPIIQDRGFWQFWPEFIEEQISVNNALSVLYALTVSYESSLGISGPPLYTDQEQDSIRNSK